VRGAARTPDQVVWRRLEAGREVVLEDVGVGVTAVPAPGSISTRKKSVMSATAPSPVTVAISPS
jgi:hypothetical protein